MMDNAYEVCTICRIPWSGPLKISIDILSTVYPSTQTSLTPRFSLAYTSLLTTSTSLLELFAYVRTYEVEREVEDDIKIGETLLYNGEWMSDVLV